MNYGSRRPAVASYRCWNLPHAAVPRRPRATPLRGLATVALVIKTLSERVLPMSDALFAALGCSRCASSSKAASPAGAAAAAGVFKCRSVFAAFCRGNNNSALWHWINRLEPISAIQAKPLKKPKSSKGELDDDDKAFLEKKKAEQVRQLIAVRACGRL